MLSAIGFKRKYSPTELVTQPVRPFKHGNTEHLAQSDASPAAASTANTGGEQQVHRLSKCFSILKFQLIFFWLLQLTLKTKQTKLTSCSTLPWRTSSF
jgi:hypothetical protein